MIFPSFPHVLLELRVSLPAAPCQTTGVASSGAGRDNWRCGASGWHPGRENTEGSTSLCMKNNINIDMYVCIYIVYDLYIHKYIYIHVYCIVNIHKDKYGYIQICTSSTYWLIYYRIWYYITLCPIILCYIISYIWYDILSFCTTSYYIQKFWCDDKIWDCIIQ